MSVKAPPHRPTPGELAAAKQMDLPNTDGYVEAMLDLVHVGRAQGAFPEALNILTALTLARPDDARLYRAMGILYTDLGRTDDAALCHQEAARLQKEDSK